MRVVKKYGGTSVGTIDKIKNVAKYLKEEKEKGHDIVAVVSAMGKSTDVLVDMAKEISVNPDVRELDTLLATGEQQSISLLTMALKNLGCKAVSLTGAQAGILTSGIHTKSKIASIDTQKINDYLKDGSVVIVAGFQGINEDGDITTLGRGGSDTSAVALAAALGCECEIYTDVDGIYSVDPRVYKDAKKLEAISYEEMMEMASLGAGVMETRAVEIGKKYGVKIYVGQSLGAKTGSYITDADEIIEKKAVKGISINNDIIMVNVEKIATYPINVSILFEALAKNEVNVDMISQNDVQDAEGSIAFTCPLNDEGFLDKGLAEVKTQLPKIEITKNKGVSKVSLVGIGVISHFGVAAKVFKVLAENNISFHQCTTSEISISIVVAKEKVELLVEKLAKAFEV